MVYGLGQYHIQEKGGLIMKVADYEYIKYRIKTKEAALRQIDRVWEKNKKLLTTRWLEKIKVGGHIPVNKTVEGLQKEFKRKVLREMSVEFGGNQMLIHGVDVNQAIEIVLRGQEFQSKEQILKTNMLGRLQGSHTLEQMKRIDPSITFSDIISNAKYVNKLKTGAEGLTAMEEIEGVFDETYDKMFEYTSPAGHRYIIAQATSTSPGRYIQIS